MDHDVVDYSSEPNPYEEFSSHACTVLGSGSFGSSLLPLSTQTFASNHPRPSVPQLPPYAALDASSRLDCPSLSPVTYNLIVEFLPPSPSFESPLPDLPLPPTPSDTPFSSGITQPGISTPHFSLHTVSPFSRATSVCLSQTLRAPHPPHKWLTRALGDPYGTTRRLLNPTNSRNGGA